MRLPSPTSIVDAVQINKTVVGVDNGRRQVALWTERLKAFGCQVVGGEASGGKEIRKSRYSQFRCDGWKARLGYNDVTGDVSLEAYTPYENSTTCENE